MLALSLMALSLATGALGSVQTQEEALTPAAAPTSSGPSWNLVSRSSSTAFMTDVNGIRQQDGITTAQLARVPTSGDAADQTHSVSEVSFRCSANQAKTGEEVYYAADGSVEERITNDFDFEPIPANSLDAYTKAIVCGGERTARSFPSIAAFIAAGRPIRD